MYGSTAGGSGPPALQIVTTPDDGNWISMSNLCFHILITTLFNTVPGPVTGLSFTKISATVLQTSWSEPEPTNGVIQVYSVQVETITNSIFQASVPGDQNSILVPNLSK